VALLARAAVSALIAIASGPVPTFGTGLRGIAGIDGNRRRLIKPGFIFEHLAEWVKGPRHGRLPIPSPDPLRCPPHPRQILPDEQRLGAIADHACLTDLMVHHVFRTQNVEAGVI